MTRNTVTAKLDTGSRWFRAIRATTGIGLLAGALVLLQMPAAYSGDGFEDIDKYPDLKAALNQDGLSGTGTILITRVVNGEPEMVKIIDPTYAEEVPAGTDPTGTHTGTLTYSLQTEVTVVTLSGSPGCTLQNIGGSLVWVPPGCHH